MQRNSPAEFVFLNVGHFLDHFFMLIFATAAALSLTTEWNLSYAELIPYATPGFIAFGVCALPAGWIADKWSRRGMIAIFFIGIGASSMLASQADSPMHIAVGLTLIGVFAAIYHPVGLAMIVQGRINTGMPLAVNGVFGNMGVASAALLTGVLIDQLGWRSAFLYPGLLSVLIGMALIYYIVVVDGHSGPAPINATEDRNPGHENSSNTRGATSSAPSSDILLASDGSGNGAIGDASPSDSVSIDQHTPAITRQVLVRTFAVIFFTTAIGGLVFQSTTFALPKVLTERLGDMNLSASLIGWYAFMVFSTASFAQLLVGYLVDRYPIRAVFSIVAATQATFLALMIQLDGVAALIVSVCFMLAVFGQIPINDVLVGRMTSSEWRSRVYALRFLVTFSVMATAVPLIAWIHHNWGFSMLFSLLSAAATLIYIATFYLPKEKQIATRYV